MEAVAPVPSARSSAWSRRPDRATTIGATLLGLLLVAALVGPWLLPDPVATNAMNTLASPSRSHLFGTDRFGRDVLARIVAGIRLDLGLAVLIAAIAFVIGTVLGALAGYFGGWVDDVIMRITDIVSAFPGFILAMLVAISLGNTTTNAVIGVTLASIPGFVRLTRSVALSERERDYVRAAAVSGASGLRIALTHILPNSMRPAIVQSSFVAGWAILNIAGLAFLGVGVQPPTAEWGLMIADGSADIVRGLWWPSLFPGIAIVLAATGLHLIGDGFEERTR